MAAVRGFWGYFLPLDLTMSTSMMFELFESLRVKMPHPLGEDAIARMLENERAVARGRRDRAAQAGK